MILADVILPSFYLTAGFVAFIPTLLFIVFSEAYIISKILKKPFKRTLHLSVKANVISGLFGAAFFWLFPVLPNKTAYPNDLYTYVQMFFICSVIAYVAYYVFSLLIEWLFSLLWRRKYMLDIKKTGFLKAFALANLVSYSILIPIHYYYNTPANNLDSITENTEWAIKPPEKVIYLENETNYLWKTSTDGTDTALFVPHEMKHYLFSSNLEHVVFFTEGRELFHYNTRSKTLTKLWESDISGSKLVGWSRLGSLDTTRHIAISPSGNRVAWTIPVSEGNGSHGPWETDYWRFFLYDFTTQNIKTHDYKAHDAKIAWSSNENAVYANCPQISYQEAVGGISGLAKFVISEDFEIELMHNVVRKEVVLADNYGRLGHWFHSGGRTYVEHSKDEYRDLKAVVLRYSKTSIRISRDDETAFYFSDIPFFSPLSRRSISEPAFIQEGKECLFEARRAIYLIGIAEKRIGKLVEGKDYIVMTDSYHKRSYFFGN
jgi:hypothetical protein